MTDSLSGHTAAQNTLGADGLRDGDALSTATLTNAVQGLHGNGILRLEDGAYASTRNATNTQPGAMVRASAHTLTVTGGYVALDGVLYEFASGPGGSATLVLGDATDGSGGVALASSSEEALYVVYVASAGGEAKVHYEGGSPVNTANGLYPVAPSAYLTDYNTGVSQSNMKTIVLAIVRVRGGGSGSHSVDIQEINDKRIFLPPSVRYMAPLSLGALSSNKVSDGGAEGINTILHLNTLQSEAGDIAADGTDSITALWPSHPRYAAFNQTAAGSSDAGYGHGPSRGTDIAGNHAKNALYFAGRNNQGTSHYSVRLDGRGVEATQTEITGTITTTLTADGDSFLMLKVATGQIVTLNPARDATSKYMFPEGYIIEVCNDGVAGKGNIVFDNYSDAADLNATLTPTQRATFIYEGSKWMRCDYQSLIGAGAAPAIEDNSGTPAFATGITKAEVLTLLNVADGATASAGTLTALTGEVTASGSGSVAATITNDAVITAKILNSNVTLAKIANIADDTMLGNISGSAAAPTAMSIANVHTLIGEATGSITGLMSIAHHDKLDAIASGAQVGTVTSIATTAPITGGSITGTGTIAISAATTSVAGSMSSADKTKLDAIEAAADVTDATNVNAAGAIMHTDLATKGTLAVGDGAGDATILAVGTDTHVLTADSGETSGVKWAAASGGTVTETFKTIVVATQSDVVADSATDTLTLVGAGATTITTNAGTDTITITSLDTDTMAAAADVYHANAGNWDPVAGPPTTTALAIDRIAVYLAAHVSPTVGGALP